MTAKMNIVLIGFMGAGKSSVAKLLAEQLLWPVVSTDELIVLREGRPITDIFKEQGEPYFRAVEKEIVRKVTQRRGQIIDCGGGVVLDLQNVANLKASGILFYLKASPEEILRRVKDETHRPLLHTEDPRLKIQELLAARAASYEQANHTIDTTGKSVEQVCREVLGVMERQGRA